MGEPLKVEDLELGELYTCVLTGQIHLVIAAGENPPNLSFLPKVTTIYYNKVTGLYQNHNPSNYQLKKLYK